MQYVIGGFTQDKGFRVFNFEGVAEDRSRTSYQVRADLALLRKYGIQTQELSLLCRGLLEHRDETDQSRTFVYTEKEMSLHAESAARDVAARRKAPRRPPTANLGGAWRTTPENSLSDLPQLSTEQAV
ncbi:MAG: hypothetical protein ABI824_18340 [Acidobacteriota bacterium]